MKKVFVFLFVAAASLMLAGCGKSNAISGKYNCSYYSDSAGETILTLELKADKSFEYIQGKGTVKGNYTYELEDKNSDEAKFYMITFSPDYILYDGEKHNYTEKFELEFAMQRKGKKKEGAVINTSTYNMFYCKNY